MYYVIGQIVEHDSTLSLKLRVLVLCGITYNVVVVVVIFSH